jgi:anti-anti-sigma factor
VLPTFWKPAPTCVPFRSYSDIPGWSTPLSTCISRPSIRRPSPICSIRCKSPASTACNVLGDGRKNDSAPPRAGRYRSRPRRSLHSAQLPLDPLGSPESPARHRSLPWPDCLWGRSGRAKAGSSRLAERNPANRFLNLAWVEHIDSSGLGTLVASFISARHRGAEIRFAARSPRVRRALTSTNVDQLFEVYDSTEEAIKSFRPHPEAADLRTVPDESSAIRTT